MRAGLLRSTIAIQSAAETRDARGEMTQSWSTLVTLRAGIYPETGSEKFQAHQLNANVTHKIVTRYHAGITPKMRVLFGARVFDIQAVINVGERNKTLNLLCLERI